MITQQHSKYTKIHYSFDFNPLLDCEESEIKIEAIQKESEWNEVFNSWCEERGPEVWDWLNEMKRK